MDIRKIYEYALQREYEGKRFFEDNAARLNQASAVGAFNALAQEEQKHIYFIQKQIKALEEGKPVDLNYGLEMQKAGFFSQRAEKEFLDQTVTEAMLPDLPVLRMAFLIERDFSEFYEMMANQAQGEAREVLKLLAGWERTHEALFKKMHDALFELYAKMPWGG